MTAHITTTLSIFDPAQIGVASGDSTVIFQDGDVTVQVELGGLVVLSAALAALTSLLVECASDHERKSLLLDHLDLTEQVYERAVVEVRDLHGM